MGGEALGTTIPCGCAVVASVEGLRSGLGYFAKNFRASLRSLRFRRVGDWGQGGERNALQPCV